MEESVSYLEIDGACKSFGGLKALDRVSLSVPKGSFLTLLGPSGCGKTTLLRSIAGLQSLDSGKITVEGRVLDPASGGPRAVMVFQDYALFPHMSVRRNVSYGLRIKTRDSEAIDRKVDETLRYLGILELDGRLPAELSGGQQQRVALARALVMEPEVLLLDEPLSNLDAKLRLGIRSELKRIQADLGVTTVYVTHDQGEALALSDSVAVMDRGRLIQVGAPRDVYLRPVDAFVADFVGTANFVEAVVLETGSDSTRVAFLGRSWVLSKGIPSGKLGKSVTLCIRPESLRLAPPDGSDSIAGTVVQAMFEGSRVRYWVDTGTTTLVVDDDEPDRDYPLRSQVAVKANPEGFHPLEGESHG
jgi:ABC-type Fe3+/spermidine/putrescine transport system ATPase subunit